jgi:hypothetical protein
MATAPPPLPASASPPRSALPHALLGSQSPTWLCIAPLCPAYTAAPLLSCSHNCAPSTLLRPISSRLHLATPLARLQSALPRVSFLTIMPQHPQSYWPVVSCLRLHLATTHNRLLVVTPFPSCDHAAHLSLFHVPSIVLSCPLPRPTSPQCSPILQPHRHRTHPPPYLHSCSLPAVLHLLRLFRVCPLAEDGAGVRRRCGGHEVQAGQAERTRCMGVQVWRSELGGADVWRWCVQVQLSRTHLPG